MYDSLKMLFKQAQIKSTMRYYLTPIRMAKNSAGKDVEKPEPSGTADGTVKWCSHFGKQ